MHRTQLYFDESIFEQVRQRAAAKGISVSAYIRQVVSQDLERTSTTSQSLDLGEFSGMWDARDIDTRALRDKAWK